jgi:hypothetical protein
MCELRKTRVAPLAGISGDTNAARNIKRPNIPQLVYRHLDRHPARLALITSAPSPPLPRVAPEGVVKAPHLTRTIIELGRTIELKVCEPNGFRVESQLLDY